MKLSLVSTYPTGRRYQNCSPVATDNTETVVTFLLLAEIFLRFAVDWRHFFLQRQNWVDSVIAIVTAIIQIPPIHDSGTPYNWLTFFQIVRIYRVVLAVPITRDLIVSTSS